MFRIGLANGTLAGAAVACFAGPQVQCLGRPVAKATLKAALAAMHEAQVQSAEIAE